jgi:hypothetical protein
VIDFELELYDRKEGYVERTWIFDVSEMKEASDSSTWNSKEG